MKWILIYILLITLLCQIGIFGSDSNGEPSLLRTSISKDEVCEQLNKNLMLPAKLSRTKPLFIIAAIFQIYTMKFVNWEDNTMTYLIFKSNLDQFIKSRPLHQWGAVIYERSCYRNRRMEFIVMDMILSRVVDHPDYRIVAVFTEDMERLPSSGGILLPYHIPIYGITVTYNKPFNYDNFHHSLRASVVLRRNLRDIRKKIEILIQRSNYGEVSLFRGAGLSQPENIQLDILLDELKQQNVCVLQNLDIPTNDLGWQKMNFTLRHVNTPSLFIGYSHSKFDLTKLANFVHAMKPNRTITWVFSRPFHYKSMSEKSKKYANIIYMRSSVKPTRNYTDIYVNQLLQRKAGEEKILRFLLKNEYLNKTIGRTVNMRENDRSTLDITYYTVFQKIKKAFKSWRPSTKMKRIYDAIQKMWMPSYVSQLTGVIFDTKRRRFRSTDLRKNVKVLLNSTRLCQSECDIGHSRVLYNTLVTCCWRCEKCPLGQYRSINMSQCQSCPLNTMSGNNRNQCFPYTTKSFEYEPLAISLCSTLTGLGILTALTIAFVFFRHRQTPVVKSSDTKLLALHLTSHIALLLIQLMTFLPTNKDFCYAQIFVTGSFWSLSSSVTLVKTQKFLRIFNSDLRQTAKEINLTKHFIRATIFCCQITSVLLALLSIFYIKDILSVTRDNEAIIEYQRCNLHSYHTVVFLYIELLLLACIVQSYRARKLPTSFNEAKYITAAVACTEVFILSYMIGGFNQNNFLIEYTFLWFANICTVLLMYGYKTFIILFRPHKNSAQYINRQLMENSSKKANHQIMFRQERRTSVASQISDISD